MKLELIGHDERYAVEQSLLALFPEERPVYGPVSDADPSRARIALREDENRCTVTVELSLGGGAARESLSGELSGSAYNREGQRRHLIGLCFFAAARTVTGKTPPWGSLTGVRPAKLASRLLEDGLTSQAAAVELEETYFVSAERAELAVESAAFGLAAKRDLADGDIAVYIGIPFCPTRCAYCSFVSSSVERSLALVEPYLAALAEEVRAAGALTRELGLRVRSFYMGGGTPTTLSASQMDRLLGVFQEAFDLTGCREYTVEAGRPDTVTPEKLRVLRERGVTRLSVNPQTMEDSVLRAIGRRHTADDIRRCMITGGVIKVVMNYILVGNPSINIAGAPISTLCCYGAIAVLNLYFVWKYSPEKPSYPQLFAKPALASAVMGAAAWAAYGLLDRFLTGRFSAYGANALATLLAIMAAVVVYGILVLALRILRAEDVQNMKKGDKLIKILHLK